VLVALQFEEAYSYRILIQVFF